MANRISIVTAAAAIVLLMSNTPFTHARSAPPPADQDTIPHAFEVASIKKHAPDPSHVFMFAGNPPGDVSRWTATNLTAKDLIGYAYGLNGFQMSGGPSWTDTEKFDVDAKVDDSMLPQLQKLTRLQQQRQMALMLRSLLTDRFKLQVTRGMTKAPAFALVVAKGGPKLKEAPPDPKTNGGHPMMTADGKQVTVKMYGNPISDLDGFLVAMVKRPVVDKTGLKGTYTLTLQYSELLDSSAESGPPSIFTALQEQLGLRLENTKTPVDTITINHIEEPSPN